MNASLVLVAEWCRNSSQLKAKPFSVITTRTCSSRLTDHLTSYRPYTALFISGLIFGFISAYTVIWRSSSCLTDPQLPDPCFCRHLCFTFKLHLTATELSRTHRFLQRNRRISVLRICVVTVLASLSNHDADGRKEKPKNSVASKPTFLP